MANDLKFQLAKSSIKKKNNKKNLFFAVKKIVFFIISEIWCQIFDLNKISFCCFNLKK